MTTAQRTYICAARRPQRATLAARERIAQRWLRVGHVGSVLSALGLFECSEFLLHFCKSVCKRGNKGAHRCHSVFFFFKYLGITIFPFIVAFLLYWKFPPAIISELSLSFFLYLITALWDLRLPEFTSD